MRVLFIFSLLALSASAFAQGSNAASAPTDADMVNRALATGKGKLVPAVTGNSLLLPYWVRGTVKMTSGTVPHPWLKYDLKGERLLWRRPTGDSLELDTSLMTEFVLRDSLRGQTYTYRRYLSARIKELPLRTAFFEVCYDSGRTALLRRRTRLLFHGSNGPSLAGPVNDRWVETSTFYLKGTDDRLEPIRLTPKSVLSALGQNAALNAYAKSAHLDLTQEHDIIQLLRYCDTL